MTQNSSTAHVTTGEALSQLGSPENFRQQCPLAVDAIKMRRCPEEDGVSNRGR